MRECTNSVSYPIPCECGYGYMKDRYVDGKIACPACDPGLGPTPKIRVENYKTLIGTPVKDLLVD